MNVGESGADTDTSMDVSDAYVDIVSYITGLKVITIYNQSGPGFSKLTTSLVKVSLNFQKLISQICQYFLSKKYEKLLQCKSFSYFFNKKYQCIWL